MKRAVYVQYVQYQQQHGQQVQYNNNDEPPSAARRLRPPGRRISEDAPRPPLTRSSGTPGEDFGFFVAITPLSRAGGDAPFAGDRAFKSFAGGTPPLVGYKPNPLIARKPPGIPELPPAPSS